MGVNVSDINAQLATVRKEIEKTRINDWKAVISKTTYNEVSDAFLDNVEKPKQKIMHKDVHIQKKYMML